MQPPLTDCARQVLDRAQAESRLLNQEFVGTEHLLLALLKLDDCAARRVLRSQHVDSIAARDALLSVMPHSTRQPGVTGTLPLSPRAQRAINNSIVKAQSLREEKVSTRILLLSLIDEPSTPFLTALRQIGGDIESLRAALAQGASEVEA